MPEKRRVRTANAPQNDNPYSQGIVAENLLFVSGQGPTDPDTMTGVDGGIEEQTRQTMENIQGIVEEAGASMDDVVKMTVYLDDMDDYDEMNRVYGGFFSEDPPARVCIEAARLPGDIAIEIEAIAQVP